MEPWCVTAVISFAALMLLISTGIPVGFALGLIGVAGTFLIGGGEKAFGMLSVQSYSSLANFATVAVPLFILMAELIAVGGVGTGIFEVFQRWLNRLPGGLASASVAASAIFGAICGSSIAGAACMGSVCVPEMIKRGYNVRLATGTVAAAGALSTLIPPSLVLIFYGLIGELSISKLFTAAMIPGIMLSLLMIIYITLVAFKNPAIAPSLPSVSWKERIACLYKILPASVLIALVLGTIYAGICTPTEAAGVGALGALFLLMIYRQLNIANIMRAMRNAAQLTSSVLIVLVGAVIFGFFLTIARVPQELSNLITQLPVSRWVIMIGINLMLIFLGCLLDVGSIILITSPILIPIVTSMGFDPIWFGVVVAVNMEMAVITPPVGLNLFVIKGIVPDVPLSDIIYGAAPFVIVELIALALVIAFPQLSLWLPQKVGL